MSAENLVQAVQRLKEAEQASPAVPYRELVEVWGELRLYAKKFDLHMRHIHDTQKLERRLRRLNK